MGKIEKISSILKNGLAELSMFTKDVASEGLKFVLDKETELNPYIKLHLYDAEKYNAQAVYFRYFENKPPIPQIYIYDESNLQNTTDELHKELWSSCRVPIFFVITQTQIKIFNSLSKEPDIKEIEPLKVIDIISKASAVKKIFSAKIGKISELSISSLIHYVLSGISNMSPSLRITLFSKTALAS